MEQFVAELGLGDTRELEVIKAAHPAQSAVTRPPQLQLVEGARSFYERMGKRILDAAAASLLLVATAPIMLVVAVAVRWQLGPGVLFRQERVGLGGDTFTMLKFRTMLHDRRSGDPTYQGVDRRRQHKHPDDPRHTPVGRFLRRTSLDELPQLINVIRGDMSLVGPRPEIASVARRHGIVDHPRHRVRPGITGLWQVSPLRTGAAIRAGLLLDAQYVSDVTLRRDLEILLKTGRAVIRMGGS